MHPRSPPTIQTLDTTGQVACMYYKTSPLVEGTASNQQFLCSPLRFTHLSVFISLSAIAWWNRFPRRLDRPLTLF